MSSIDAKPFIDAVAPYLVTIGVTIVAALGSFLTQKLSKYLNAAQQQVLQKSLADAAGRGAALAYSALATTGSTIADVPIHNAAVSVGVNYVLNAMTDTIKASGVTPDHVASMVTAELGKLLAADAGVTVGAPQATTTVAATADQAGSGVTTTIAQTTTAPAAPAPAAPPPLPTPGVTP
jgi:hypothetical protein